MSVQPGTLIANEYRVVEPIARGGMGEVYVVEQVSTGKRRALKLMKPELLSDGTLLARFEQEAKIGSRVESDHIVEVVGAGVDQELGMPWLAMELLQGESLGAMISRRGPLPASEVRVLFAQIGHALTAAHRAGVVHRDLKPENIFVARVQQLGVDYKVKILDFGIAKLFEDASKAAPQLTGTLSLGTPRYMAPEQTGGQPITPQTDVWALGLIAFQALTGRYYWKRASGGPNESVMTLMKEVLFEPLAKASRRAADYGVAQLLPSGFDAWFAKCVAREASERFRDGGEAVQALDAVLANAGNVAAPPARSVAPTGQAGTTTFGQSAATNVDPTSRDQLTAPMVLGQPKPPPKLSAGQKKNTLVIAIIAGFVSLGVVGGGGYGIYKAVAGPSKKKKVKDDDDEPRRRRDDAQIPADIAATYDAQGELPDKGGPYASILTVTGQGSAYRFAWSNGVEAVALRTDTVVGAAWGTGVYGVTVYDVDRGKLTGKSLSSLSGDRIEDQVLSGPDNLGGTYDILGGNSGSVIITPTGATYDVTYNYASGAFAGVGILVGKQLVVGWGGVGLDGGVAVYTRNGKLLDGKWASRGDTRLGTEKLKKKGS